MIRRCHRHVSVFTKPGCRVPGRPARAVAKKVPHPSTERVVAPAQATRPQVAISLSAAHGPWPTFDVPVARPGSEPVVRAHVLLGLAGQTDSPRLVATPHSRCPVASAFARPVLGLLFACPPLLDRCHASTTIRLPRIPRNFHGPPAQHVPYTPLDFMCCSHVCITGITVVGTNLHKMSDLPLVH